MTNPQRLKPATMPPVQPVWEFQATGDLLEAYEDYKASFQVPWVGVITMALAHYRTMFDTWWAGIKPLVTTREYLASTVTVRRQVEEIVQRLSPPPIAQRLRDTGYSERELDNIRDTIEFLSHGNFTQMLILSVHLLLEGGEFKGVEQVTPFVGSHAVQVSTPFVLMERHHALPDLQAVYQDIMTRLDLPIVNTDYRALSRWPSYFAMAWADLCEYIGTAAHEALAQYMHESMFNAVAALPNPGGLTSAAMRTAAEQDAPIEEILDVAKLFTYLIPPLMVNVAFFRAQLMKD